jgi:hypothetical protein
LLQYRPARSDMRVEESRTSCSMEWRFRRASDFRVGIESHLLAYAATPGGLAPAGCPRTHQCLRIGPEYVAS